MSETTDHLSALQLDALALGAVSPSDAERYRAHLAACSACRTERDHAAELAQHFTVNVLPRQRPARPSRWLFAIAPALAVAAVLVLFLMRDKSPEADLGVKGGPAWRVVASRGDKQFFVHDGTVLAAGDRLRFQVIPDGATFLLVMSVDGAGAVSVYYPFEGTRSAAIAPGPQVELPDSIVLDAAPGPERLFALFSKEPIEADAIRGQLGAIGRGGAAEIRAAQRLDVHAQGQLTLVFEKAAR